MSLTPKIPYRKKGDSYTAKDQRAVARAVNSLGQGGVEKFNSHGETHYKAAFKPVFFYEGATFYVRVIPSRIGSNHHELGRNEWSVPKLDGDAIVNPDLTDREWTPPKLTQTAGDWGMWLVSGVADTDDAPDEIIIQETSDPDPTAKPPWKNVFKLATWTVASSGGSLLASNIISYTDRGIEHTPTSLQPFEPYLWWDGAAFKAKFTPAQLLIYKTGSALDVTVNSAAMATSTGVTVAAGDEWWAKVDTSNMGAPSAVDLQKATSPTNTQFAEPLGSSGTDGEYWFKVCSFAADGDLLIPTMHHIGNIPWAPRPWENVGSGAEVIKEFSNGKYSARSIAGTGGTEPSASTGETKYTLFIDTEEDGDDVKITGSVVVTDGDGLPSGSAGQMLYHNGTDWVVLAAPAAPGSDEVNILTHNGTLPAWETKDIGTHKLCVSGTPTDVDIIEM